MTIKELYDWAVKNEYTDYNITITYGDGGGFYDGTRYASYGDIIVHHDFKEVEL